jgi:hypothetical protein
MTVSQKKCRDILVRKCLYGPGEEGKIIIQVQGNGICNQLYLNYGGHMGIWLYCYLRDSL